MNYTLRPAAKSDFDFLYHLVEVCMREYVDATWTWDEEFQRDHFAEHFDIAGCQIVLVNGRQAGQRTVFAKEDNEFISAIYLLPEFQNQGLGSKLLQEVLAGAAKNGRSVTLQVLKANRPARRLYERLGFVITAEKMTHYVMKWQPNPTQ